MNVFYMPVGKMAFKRVVVTITFYIIDLRREILSVGRKIQIVENVIIVNKIFAVAILFHFFGKLALCKYLPDSLHRKALD